MTVWTYQRGETVVLALDAVIGDPALVTAASVILKRAVIPDRIPGESEPDAATLTVEPRDASGDIPAGWFATLSAEDCGELAPGAYYAGLSLTLVDGAVVKGTSPRIVIQEAVA